MHSVHLYSVSIALQCVLAFTVILTDVAQHTVSPNFPPAVFLLLLQPCVTTVRG